MGSIYSRVISVTLSKSYNLKRLKQENLYDLLPTLHLIDRELRPRTEGDLPEMTQELLELILGAGGLLQVQGPGCSQKFTQCLAQTCTGTPRDRFIKLH